MIDTLTPDERRALLVSLAARFADAVGYPSRTIEGALQRAQVEGMRDLLQRERRARLFAPIAIPSLGAVTHARLPSGGGFGGPCHAVLDVHGRRVGRRLGIIREE